MAGLNFPHKRKGCHFSVDMNLHTSIKANSNNSERTSKWEEIETGKLEGLATGHKALLTLPQPPHPGIRQAEKGSLFWIDQDSLLCSLYFLCRIKIFNQKCFNWTVWMTGPNSFTISFSMDPTLLRLAECCPKKVSAQPLREVTHNWEQHNTSQLWTQKCMPPP